jgi:hypothetical protein
MERRCLNAGAVSALVVGLLGAWAVGQATQPTEGVRPVQVGESLLRFPEVTIARDGTQGPRGFWTGVGLGKGSFRYAREPDGTVVATMVSDGGPARLQYGTACVAPAIERFWEQTIEIAVEVRGNVTALGPTQGQGAVLQIQVNGPAGGGGRSFGVGPNTTREGGREGGRAKLNEKVGEFGWTTLRARFRVPVNTSRVDMLMYLLNSEGELAWRNPRMNVIAPESPVDEKLPDAWMSAAEAKERESARMKGEFDKLWTGITGHLKTPEAAELYELPGDLAERRPRLYVREGLTLDTLRKRWADPRYEKIVGPMRRYADGLAGFELPVTQNVDGEDPMRGFADGLTLLTVASAVTTDEAERERWFAAAVRWADRQMSWGPSPRNLVLAQSQLAYALLYDWHYARLSAEQRAKYAGHLLALAEASYDFGNPHTNWIFGRQYVANHLWFNYMGRTVTSLALWGEKGVDTAPLKQYLDDAARNYWIIAQTHSREGMPHEGFLYQDYGLRPYVDFLAITEPAMGWKYDLIDKPANRTMGVRIHAMLPGERGFMVTSDARAEQFSGYPFFYWVASRFEEPVAQALAQIMQRRALVNDMSTEVFLREFTRPVRPTDINGWRALLWYDPNVKAADIAKLPTHFADTNMGFFTARSDWSADAAFFGLKCGTLSGKAVSEKFGRQYLGVAVSGHCYPEQGNFVLQIGTTDYLPNVDYSRQKVTTNHNLLVFAGREKQKDRWVGQVGEGGAWLMGPAYTQFQREAEVLEVRNAADHHYYLCDIGGLYRLEDSRAEGGVTFPTYRRELTFLTEGAVVIVDHVKLEQPRAVRLNLLTGGVSGEVSGDEVGFVFKDGGKGRIKTASSVPVTLAAGPGEVLSWGRNDRYIVSMTTGEVGVASVAAVVGPEALVSGMKLERRGEQWVLVRSGKGELVVGSEKVLEREVK